MNGETFAERAGQRLWRISRSVFHFIRNSWKAVVFSAALAVILDHLGFLTVLIKVSLLVVSSMASHDGGGTVNFVPGMPVVVVINANDFNTRYAERSPLNRCVLQADIAKVLAKSPKRLAIDFDLSPVADASDGEQHCQKTLDNLLDQHARQLILLVPFPAVGTQLFDLKRAWIQDRCRAQLHFADGNIEQSMGMVTEQLAGEDEQLDARMANQLHQGFSGLVCDSVLTDDDPRNNPWLTDARTVVAPERETQPINFPKAIERLAVVTLGTSAYEALPSLAASPVLLGGDWGKDDSFLTSIGTLPGVVIHAARLISLQDPIQSLSPWVNLLSDLGIALCFAWVIEQFWEHYVMARRMDLAFENPARVTGVKRVTGLSSLVMLAFVCVYLGLVFFFFIVAEHMFAHWNVVIAPLLIALSMLIDGFVSGPVEAMEKLLKPGDSHSEPERDLSEPSPESRAMLWALGVSGVVLLAYATLYRNVREPTALASAYGFVATLSVLYLLFFLHQVWRCYHVARRHRLSLLHRVWKRQLYALCQDGLSLLCAICHLHKLWRLVVGLGVGEVYGLGRFCALTRQGIFWFTLAVACCFLSGVARHL